jgi:hypothetical protein
MRYFQLRLIMMVGNWASPIELRVSTGMINLFSHAFRTSVVTLPEKFCARYRLVGRSVFD